MTLAPIGETGPADLARWVAVLGPARQLAEVLAGTDFVPRAMKGKPDQVCAAIMYGDELDLGPMQALAGIDVVEGKPRPSAELCRALILRAGHSFTVHDMNGTRCRVSGLRAGRPESERAYVEWTLDMARAAGLTSKANWRSYPRAMLLARATSDLARLLFPDVVKGLGYVVEDADNAATLEGWGPPLEAGNDRPPVAPALPQRKTKTRRPALRDPGHTIATETKPGPDGSVDVPLPEEVPPWDDRELVRAVDDPAATPADLPPEEPPEGSEPEAPPSPIRPGKLKAVHTLLSIVAGSEAPISDRRSLLSAILGRDVPSTKALTQAEGDRALDVLTRIETGALECEATAAGGWVIRAPAGLEADPPAAVPTPAPVADPWDAEPDPAGDHVGDPWRS